MHEAQMHEDNSFITLTYSPENLPPHGSLRKADFQKFMKRLRFANDGKRIRYFHVGEYGDDTQRPHYHAILFGHHFEDRELHRVGNGAKHYRSRSLEACWPYGFSEVGETVNVQVARYVARYCTKKITGKLGEEFYTRVDPETGEIVEVEKEYATMSRRPGIGYPWFEKYWKETYRDDSVVIDGKEFKPPEYYDSKFVEFDPERMEELKAKRQDGRDRSEEKPHRMAAREKCAKARVRESERREVF